MSKKLWQKTGVKLDKAIENYTVGDDYINDDILVPYDVVASKAHVKMLKEIGIFDYNELDTAIKAFDEILQKWDNGEFLIKLEDEDCHTAIENYITEKYGDLGKKIHTGRSRNDQVLVAMHLFMRDQIEQIIAAIESLVEVLNAFTKDHGDIKMPGYTHMQRAMPMDIRMLISAYTSSLADDKKLLESTLEIINQNPLGSAAGFGINGLKLDREFTTKLLGFNKVMNPPLYCQNSRGKFASMVVSALSQVMMSLGKIASDLMLFTTREFDYFSIDESLTTGSSIMPQKKNFDVMELLRANVAVVQSYEFRLKNLGTNLISGYHRDFQLSKEPLINAFEITLNSLFVTRVVFNGLSPNQDKLIAAMDEEIFATDKVYELVDEGMSFREAYNEVKGKLS